MLTDLFKSFHLETWNWNCAHLRNKQNETENSPNTRKLCVFIRVVRKSSKEIRIPYLGEFETTIKNILRGFSRAQMGSFSKTVLTQKIWCKCTVHLKEPSHQIKYAWKRCDWIGLRTTMRLGTKLFFYILCLFVLMGLWSFWTTHS
jgi:hypothetical protein